MTVEQQVLALLEEGEAGLGAALLLLASEIDALKAAIEERPAGELTPSERASILYRARAILDEMGDGSE